MSTGFCLQAVDLDTTRSRTVFYITELLTGFVQTRHKN